MTCLRLASTFQNDADLLASWYSGLAKKHYLNIGRAKQAQHEAIVYCKANPDKLIIEAIAVIFKGMRARLGITLKPSD